MILFAPIGDETTVSFVPVRARLIIIRGYKEFPFCVHRSLGYDKYFKVVPQKTGWTVASLPTGMRIATSTTERDAIRQARERLIVAGKAKLIKGRQEGLKIVNAVYGYKS